MKIFLTLALTTIVASAAPARCDGIKFDTVHYNPSSFSPGERFDVTYYGQATRKVDRDVYLRTTFKDEDRDVFHKSVVNWCTVLEKYGGKCPMSPGDGFKLTVKHNFEADDIGDNILVVTQAVGAKSACYGYHEDEVPVDDDDNNDKTQTQTQ